MKYLYFLLLFTCLGLQAQTTDSLLIARRLDSLIQQSRQLINNKEYDTALKLLEQVKSETQTNLGKTHVLMGSCLHQYGRAYQLMNKMPEALNYYLEAKAVRAINPGENHLDYAQTVYNLGNIYWRMGKKEEAEKSLLKVAEIRLALSGESNVDYINVISDLGELYSDMANYEKAEPFLLNAKNLREKVLGKESMDYAASLNRLAVLYRRTAQYERAEPFIYEALRIIEKLQGKKNVYANTLNGLANLYWDKGDYERAIEIHLENKDIREKSVGKEHPDYAQSLINLSNLYIKTGKYELAESLLMESKKIRENYYGKENAEYAKVTMGLAYLFLEVGNYEKAEMYYIETKAIREKELGKENTDYASTLNGLAAVYSATGRYESAERLYDEIRVIYEKKLGKNHPYYARNRNNMADMYFQKGDYKRAETLLLEAKGIHEAKGSKEHPEYALCLSNLSNIYLNTGEYALAETYCHEALALQEKMLGKENPYYVKSLETLAKICLATKRYDTAEPLFAELSELRKLLVVKGINHLSEKELFHYIKLYHEFSNLLLFFASQKQQNTLNILAWNDALFVKGILLDNTRALERIILTSNDTLKNIHAEWKTLLRRLAAANEKAEGSNQSVANWMARADSLEKTLIRSVSAFAELHRQYTWIDVQTKLRKEEAAVEFVNYALCDKYGNPTDSIQYAALVLTYNSRSPIWVPLCSQKQIDALLPSEKKYNTELINRFYATDYQLYELVWKPIERELAVLQTPIKTFYLAPSGILHRINFNAIAVGPGEMLSDHYRLAPKGSMRYVAAPAVFQTGNQDAVLFGGIRYDADTTDLQQKFSALTPIDEALAVRGLDPLNGGSWRYLPFTEREISSIERILAKNKLKPIVRKNMAATEDAFKRIGQFSASPRVLHIATHGFFFPDPKSIKDTSTSKLNLVFKDSDNPMVRTGLILAGANRTWQGKTPLMQQDDGVLTAYEISQMNLNNTELVVLSACETGLGDIQGSEGVYGLQRAFKMAGARYVILSLWQTPDKQTAQLMTIFYLNWLEKKMDIPNAFRAAQKQMRDLGLEPNKWAGFVLIE